MKKTPAPAGKELLQMLKNAYRLWDDGILSTADYDKIAVTVVERAYGLYEEKRIAYRAFSRINDEYSANSYVVHDVPEL